MARWRIAAADIIIITVKVINFLYSISIFFWPISGWLKLPIAYVWYYVFVVCRDFITDLRSYSDVLEDMMGTKIAQRAVSWTDRESILEKCTYQACIIAIYFLVCTFMIQKPIDASDLSEGDLMPLYQEAGGE
jgi:hypothetical protein